MDTAQLTTICGPACEGMVARAVRRRFPNLPESGQDYGHLRIWAGAQFRSANEGSHRLATVVVARALAAVPPLAK